MFTYSHGCDIVYIQLNDGNAKMDILQYVKKLGYDATSIDGKILYKNISITDITKDGFTISISKDQFNEEESYTYTSINDECLKRAILFIRKIFQYSHSENLHYIFKKLIKIYFKNSELFDIHGPFIVEVDKVDNDFFTYAERYCNMCNYSKDLIEIFKDKFIALKIKKYDHGISYTDGTISIFHNINGDYSVAWRFTTIQVKNKDGIKDAIIKLLDEVYEDVNYRLLSTRYSDFI